MSAAKAPDNRSVIRAHYKGKRVLVTGGYGFIGTNLSELLLRAGASVTRMTRSITTIPGAPPAIGSLEHTLEGDLADGLKPSWFLDDFDYLFHLAALDGSYSTAANSDPVKQTEIMLSGSRMGLAVAQAALSASRKPGARFKGMLVCSSSAVYDNPIHMGVRGNAGYVYSKTISEIAAEYAHAASPKYSWKLRIMRPTNPYGPHDLFSQKVGHVVPSLIVKFVTAGKDNITIQSSPDAIVNLIYVRDLVAEMAVSMLSPMDYEVTDCADTEITMRELVSLIAEQFHVSMSRVKFRPSKEPPSRLGLKLSEAVGGKWLEYVKQPAPYGGGRLADSVGVRRTPHASGIRITVDWYKSRRSANSA